MVIAELCQNHRGQWPSLVEMAQTAAKCGVWACKIQTFFAEDLTPNFKDQFERMKSCQLTWDQHTQFVTLCNDLGVTPITSVYTKKYAMKLKGCGFKWIKIGSADVHRPGLVQDYVNLGFNVIISTGGQDLEKIPKCSPKAVLHCVSKYPHSPFESNLVRMYECHKRFPNALFGFSDHSAPTHTHALTASMAAIDMGAEIIERHFTIFSRSSTKDGSVSLLEGQLKILCDYDKQEKPVFLLRKNIYFSSQNDQPLIKKYQERWRT